MSFLNKYIFMNCFPNTPWKNRRYNFKHVWSIKAPVKIVWETVCNPGNWPSIFYGFSIDGEMNKIEYISKNSNYNFTIKDVLPYKLSFHAKILSVISEKKLVIQIDGDLKGKGEFELFRDGEITNINFDMNVVPVKYWMRVIAPAARKFFIKNHNLVVDNSYNSLKNRIAMEMEL